MRRRTVAAKMHEDLRLAADYRDRDLVALRLAGVGGGCGNGECHRHREVPVLQKLRVHRNSERAANDGACEEAIQRHGYFPFVRTITGDTAGAYGNTCVLSYRCWPWPDAAYRPCRPSARRRVTGSPACRARR